MASENNKTNYYISSLLRKLESSSTSSVQKALISLSRATRKSENVVKLRDEGGINLLLTFVQSSNKKALDMAVSVLANCALEKQSRTEIKKLNGLALLCKLSECKICIILARWCTSRNFDCVLVGGVMHAVCQTFKLAVLKGNLLASLADTSILSRVTRALANLSQDVTVANEIANLDAVPKLLGILKESTDVHLLQNTLRALRIMSRSYACIKVLADCNGILYFVELLHKENGNEIKRCCLQTLLELTRAANGVLATQTQEHSGIEIISQLSYSDEEDIKENCINILATLTRYSSVRVSVGTMGGIEAFIHQIQARGPMLLPSIEGICMCCREAVNRNKVRSCGGLEVLLGILRCPGYSQVFDNILGAFACFSYDDLALKRMLAGGLVSILVSILQKLLFPENTIKVATEKKGNDFRTTSNQTTATTTPKESATSASSEDMLKPTDSATTLSSSITSDSAKSITLPLLPERYYPSSPPSSISPNLSPELRIPYLSPCSSQSARSTSPRIYSPSGSEVDDDLSSESNDHPDQETVEDDRSAASQDFTAPTSDEPTAPASNEATISKAATGSCIEEAGEEVSPNIDSTATSGNVLSTLMGDLTTTHSGMATACEGMFKKLDESDWQHCQPLQNEESLPPHSASGSQARVPLLPGTSFNEHLHLFLTNENLFSADQPSPRKVQRHAANKFPWMRRSRSVELPKTSKRSDPSPQASSNSSALQGIECKIIFLLSRFGQMPDITDSEALLSPECVQALLDYLCYSKNPDPRCFRLLNRLAWDRKFFETLIVIIFPGAIYRQLICGLRPGYLRSDQSSSGTEFDNKEKDSSVETPKTSSITIRTLAEVMPATTSDNTQISSTEGIATESNEVGSKYSFLSPLTSKRKEQHFIDDATRESTTTRVENISRHNTEEFGKSLLSILTTQACTSFGEGILAHLLLRGTQKQKEACALSLPYLCKPWRMKRRLLVDCKGIMIILSILCNSTEQADIIRAVNSLTFLIANSTMKVDINDFKIFIAKNESQILIPCGYRVVDLLSTKNQETGKDSATTAERDRNAARITSEDHLQTESTPKEKNSEEQKFGSRTDNNETLPATCLETDRLPEKKDEVVLTSERDHIIHSATNQGDCSSKMVPKRGRRVIDGIACKRAKVESGSTELETCSRDCSYNKTHLTPFDVVVKVDTGESIEAHRSILCAFSDVFAAMLSSGFMEATQSEITMKDLNHATVLFLVHYAYGCSWSVDKRSIACPLFEESLSSDNSLVFDFLLDLLACADQYLLTGLKKQCEQLMMYFLTAEHVVDAYLAAVLYDASCLRLYSLQYTFLGDLEWNCVCNCVARLLQSQERDRVIEDFQDHCVV